MDKLAHLLRDQDGVVARRQLVEAKLTATDIARLLRRGQLVAVHPGIYVDHNGPLPWQQRAWAAVLFCWPAALVRESALRAFEGPGRSGAREVPIHVAVGRGRKIGAPSGVLVHRTAHLDARVLWSLGPPRTRYEETVLDIATSRRSDLDAVAALADACGGRRTTAGRLLIALDARPRSARRGWLEGILRDVAVGTCSVLEYGYLDLVERPHGLPVGVRQARDAVRPLFRDVLYDESGTVVELDGRLGHDSALGRDHDLERDLDAATYDLGTLRLGYGQVFDRPCSTAFKIAKVLQQRGWPGAPVPCQKCGALRQPA